MVAVLVLRDNTASFPRRRESMVAVLVLRDNTASFPRRRESIEYDTCFVGWAKRSVPNALEVSIPKVCQATCPNCQAAKSESPHPVFQVAGHTCVECSLGFVAHDVERGLSYDCAPLWIPAFAGMTGEACVGGNPWFLFSFSMITLRHSRVGGNPWLPLVLHDNTESFPRRHGIHGCCDSFSVITPPHSRAGGNPWLLGIHGCCSRSP